VSRQDTDTPATGHLQTVDNVVGNTYQLLKDHIFGDPLCGSIEMRQQKHM